MLNNMRRREFIVGLSALMGGALSTAAINALDGVTGFVADGPLKILNEKQVQFLKVIADIIIPETDTPGASEVGVHNFIDHMLAKWMAKDAAKVFLERLNDFMASEPTFLKQSLMQQTATIQKLDDEMQEGKRHSEFYRSVKELTLVGYYTSEAGATLELAYDPVPGPYHQVSTDEYSRTWAS